MNDKYEKDEGLRNIILEIFNENYQKYGVPRITFELKNRTDLDLMMIFDPAANSCAIRSFGIAKIQEGTEDKIYALLNRLNAQFRWVKFTLIESSKTIVAADDLLLEEKTIGEETFSHAMQMARIIDEAYPEIMQTIWGGK